VPTPIDVAPGGDEIRLTLPARADHGRIARVMVSRLGVRHGFRPREVEDLRIATDEAIILLLGTVGARDGSLTVRARLTGPSLSVEVVASHAEEPEPAALARFQELVADLVDDAEVEADNGTVRFHRHRG
jgi:hypothetical protein